MDPEPSKALFWITVDEDFSVRYPANMSEIEIRGWLDKVTDGIKESMKMRAMLASGKRG
jgi:hypothetical protein